MQRFRPRRIDEFFDNSTKMASLESNGWYYCNVCHQALYGRCVSGTSQLGRPFVSCLMHKSVSVTRWLRACSATTTMRAIKKVFFPLCMNYKPGSVDMFAIVDILRDFVFGPSESSSYVELPSFPIIGPLPLLRSKGSLMTW